MTLYIIPRGGCRDCDAPVRAPGPLQASRRFNSRTVRMQDIMAMGGASFDVDVDEDVDSCRFSVEEENELLTVLRSRDYACARVSKSCRLAERVALDVV